LSLVVMLAAGPASALIPEPGSTDPPMRWLVS
jgi:hypothetical protein